MRDSIYMQAPVGILIWKASVFTMIVWAERGGTCYRAF